MQPEFHLVPVIRAIGARRDAVVEATDPSRSRLVRLPAGPPQAPELVARITTPVDVCRAGNDPVAIIDDLPFGMLSADVALCRE